MTPFEFQTEALKTWTGSLPGTPAGLEYLRLGLVSEVGEVAGVLKRILRDGWPMGVWRQKLVLELGDVAWYEAVRIHEGGRCSFAPHHIQSTLADSFIWLEVKARMIEAGITWEEIFDAVIDKLRDRQARGVIQGEGDNR